MDWRSDRLAHVYPTVGGERAQGYRLAELHCLDCKRFADVPTDGLPDDTRVIDIWQRFRCSICGSKRLQSRMSIHEHYAVMREKTGVGYGLGVAGTGADLRRFGAGRTDMIIQSDDYETKLGQRVTIASQADYEWALNRIEELSGCLEDTKEEQELFLWRQTCGLWERAHGIEVDEEELPA